MQIPDGKVEFLLGTFQKASEGLIGLVEANEQYLLHPRDLQTETICGGYNLTGGKFMRPRKQECRVRSEYWPLWQGSLLSLAGLHSLNFPSSGQRASTAGR